MAEAPQAPEQAATERRAGLSVAEARALLARYGPNRLPEARPPSLPLIFLRQFLNPLIYILLAAAIVSLLVSDARDALFIGIVLLTNGIIGALQEYSASRAALALRRMEQPRATVMRDGRRQEIDSALLVPGDALLLEAGARIPADARLEDSTGLECDESLLTGESLPVLKETGMQVFAGTLATRGRALATVCATGTHTELGRIAGMLGARSQALPPLIIRMQRFTRYIAIGVCAAIVVLAAIGAWRGMETAELFLMAVGLAVSAIPEGLPIAVSVALAIGMRRMAKRNVIVRNMPAVEALGSCTMIATDKTGTLTMNELTVTDILLPNGARLTCETGEDLPSCRIRAGQKDAAEQANRLLRAAALSNEGALLHGEDGWHGQGDTVDVALLAAAHKGGVRQPEMQRHYPLLSRIPYEPDLKYSASFHQGKEKLHIFVKGAPEALIVMCSRMAFSGETPPLDEAMLLTQKDALAAEGLRVLAFAEGTIEDIPGGGFSHRHLVDLTFLGMAGMQDPIRPEVPAAIRECKSAGIEITMITGDDPKTAAFIAREAGLNTQATQAATGQDIERAQQQGEAALDAVTRTTRIFARVQPAQKLMIVQSLARNGHFVTVTGDGVNDAPALKHAHVGVAMGRKGTDVAKESADIILTDDHFASIVAGIREGRVAYANIRKVIFMLISTGAAEVLLFMLAMLAGTPMPLFPVQLLWLNLVTNGIQDIALACEKEEGDELRHPPRKPDEPIFNRVMTRRILSSALVMGGGGFFVFFLLLRRGYAVEEARNLLLLLFVLFENLQCLCSRSERHSLFRQKFFSNPLLVLSVIAAQGIHIAAMYLPGVSGTLNLSPVSVLEWLWLLLAASALPLVMEAEKWADGRRRV